MAHKVFISYSHKDNQIAFALCNKLEDEGVKCWIAPRDIGVGKTWANEIADALPKSKIMILILSESSNASEQVLREVEIAVHNKTVILPVRIEDIMPTGGMSYYLATMQWIDVKGDKIDSKISLISKRTRKILRGFEDDEEEKRRKLELIEKQRIEQENLIKAQAEAKAAEELLKKQEKERQRKEKLELKENKRQERELQAKARIDAKNANKLYKLQEKEKLLQKKKELAENVRLLKYAKNEKASVKDKSQDNKNKTNAKKITIISLSVVLAVAVGLVLFFLRDDIFRQEDKLMAAASPSVSITFLPTHVSTHTPTVTPVATPIPTTKLYQPEDFGWEPSMEVDIEDEVLKKIIHNTLISQGVDVDDGVTIEEMFMIETIASYSSNVEKKYGDDVSGWYYEFWNGAAFNIDDAYITDGIVNNLESLKYAKNLKNLLLCGYEIKDIQPISELENIQLLYLSHNSIDRLDAIQKYTQVQILNLSYNNIYDITPLAGYTLVSRMSIRNNNISDLSPIKELSSLWFLEIEFNNLSNISVLDEFDALDEIGFDLYTYNQNMDTINLLVAKGMRIETTVYE